MKTPKIPHRTLATWLSFLFCVLISSLPVLAQTGSLHGTVTDPSGAVIASATVTVTGSASDLDGLAAAAEAAITSPHSDELAKGDYRKQIAGAIAKRAVKAAV